MPCGGGPGVVTGDGGGGGGIGTVFGTVGVGVVGLVVGFGAGTVGLAVVGLVGLTAGCGVVVWLDDEDCGADAAAGLVPDEAEPPEPAGVELLPVDPLGVDGGAGGGSQDSCAQI